MEISILWSLNTLDNSEHSFLGHAIFLRFSPTIIILNISASHRLSKIFPVDSKVWYVLCLPRKFVQNDSIFLCPSVPKIIIITCSAFFITALSNRFLAEFIIYVAIPGWNNHPPFYCSGLKSFISIFSRKVFFLSIDHIYYTTWGLVCLYIC